MEGRHPVSLLQELMARQHKQLPVYEISDLSTKMYPQFKCKVKVDTTEGIATCSSKQSAKRKAAEDALRHLHFEVHKATASPNSGTSQSIDYNAIGILNEYTAKHRLSYPTYDECGINSSNEFIIKCNILNYSVEGSAATKKVAKQIAAHNMVKLLENENLVGVAPKQTIDKTKLVSDDDLYEKFKNVSIGRRRLFPVTKVRNSEITSVKSESESDEENNKETPESIHEVKLTSNYSSSFQKTPETVEEITNELEELNLVFSIDILSKEPCVLLLKFENEEDTTVVQTGKNYQEAYSNLLKSGIKVIRALNMKKNLLK